MFRCCLVAGMVLWFVLNIHLGCSTTQAPQEPPVAQQDASVTSETLQESTRDSIIHESISTSESSSENTRNYKADPSLLVPWTSERQAQEPLSPPYLSLYADARVSLLFLAARHEVGLQTPTFQMIRETLPLYKPDIVVVEGYPTTQETSPASYLNYATGCFGPKGSNQCGEPPYLAYLAHQASIPFVGGEPTDPDLLTAIQTKGYTVKDMFGFYYLRQLAQWLSRGQFSSDVEHQYNSYLKTLFQRFEVSNVSFSFDEFQAWYQNKMGKAFEAKSIQTNDVAPLQDAKATWLQKLSYQVSLLRDTHLVHLLARLLNQYDRVFITYGSGHLVKQRRVLNNMLGSPQWSRKTYKEP
ncbi:MAG: hypothetical protein EP343_02285 [Deltaproteobacteria bacterium]|nr:MAG: hypothetical protein EP343_02285 [Deltaproteobacteria bacterium]